MIEALNIVLLALLAVTAVAIARLHNLLAVTMLAGIYSLLTAGLFVLLDAVDVALTEAAVGAGITTVLFVGTLILTGLKVKPRQARRHTIAPLALVIVTGAALVFASLDPAMPRFGDTQSPANQRLAPEFIGDSVLQVGRDSPTRVGIPNVVTSVLASYRGWDTLGEVVVVFTAGIAVIALLGPAARRKRRSKGLRGANPAPLARSDDEIRKATDAVPSDTTAAPEPGPRG